MAKPTKKATIIDAEPVEAPEPKRGVKHKSSSGSGERAASSNQTGAPTAAADNRPQTSGGRLALILSATALLISLIALGLGLFPRPGTPAPDTAPALNPGVDVAAVAALDARLAALEASTPDSADPPVIGAINARLAGLESETGAALSRLDTALNALDQDIQATALALATLQATTLALSAPAATSPLSAADSGAVDIETLTLIRGQLAGLSLSVEGSLTRIGGLYDDLADQGVEIAATQARLQSVESLGADLPARLEADQQALEAARGALLAQLEALSGALDEATTAREVEALAIRADLGSAIEQLRSSVEARLAALEADATQLMDDFRAAQQVSVQASTQILAASQLRDALAQAAPIRLHLQALVALQPTDPALQAVISALNGPAADQRVATADNLASRLMALSPVLVNETRVNAAEGRTGKLLARIAALVSLERIGEADDLPGVEGALTRALVRIEEGDFHDALAEIEAVQSELQLDDGTRQRLTQLLEDLRHRAAYGDQNAALRGWISAALAAARAGDQS